MQQEGLNETGAQWCVCRDARPLAAAAYIISACINILNDEL